MYVVCMLRSIFVCMTCMDLYGILCVHMCITYILICVLIIFTYEYEWFCIWYCVFIDIAMYLRQAKLHSELYTCVSRVNVWWNNIYWGRLPLMLLSNFILHHCKMKAVKPSHYLAFNFLISTVLSNYLNLFLKRICHFVC